MLPAVAFFELMSDPPDVDWALCDPGALSREPAWIQSALEILSVLQMDGEWLLGLSEAEQVTVAQVTSAKDAGGALSEAVLDDLHELLAGGARGTAFGVFDLPSSESEAMTDEEEPAGLSDSASSQHPVAASPATQSRQGPRSTRNKTQPGQLCLEGFFSNPARPRGGTSDGPQEGRPGQQQTSPGRSRSRAGRQQERQQERVGRQQERAGSRQ